MKIACFGGAAAVADEAAVAPRPRSRHRGLPAFRGRFLPGNKGKKSPAAAVKLLMRSGTEGSPCRGREVDVEAVYDMVFGASPSVPSSSALSTSASLDSSCTSSPCPSSLSSSSFLIAPPPPPAKRPKRGSPVAGAAAVVVCLVMLLLCGPIGATLLTSTALCFFPLRWSRAGSPVEYSVPSPEYDAASAREEEEMTKRKVIMEGFLVRNRKK